MVISLGDEERAAMYLELERTVKELKEQWWRLERVHRFLLETSSLIMEKRLEAALNKLEKNEATDLLDIEKMKELLRNVIELQAKKEDLEKKLSVKISLE